jgi:hypothetical protein
MPHTIHGWLGNRVDSPDDLEVGPELAREFMASRYYDPDGPLRHPLLNWLASADGRNISWENDTPTRDAIDALYDAVRELEKAGASGA